MSNTWLGQKIGRLLHVHTGRDFCLVEIRRDRREEVKGRRWYTMVGAAPAHKQLITFFRSAALVFLVKILEPKHRVPGVFFLDDFLI